MPPAHAPSIAEPTAEDVLALADNLPELVWMADADGWVFWYNKRWYDYTGTTPAQMQGWGWQSVHDPAVLPDVLAHWNASLTRGEHFEMVFPLRGADGLYRPFLTRVHPHRDAEGRITRWFGSNTEIRAQQQIADEIKDQKRILETLNRTASVVAAELNLEKLVQTVTDTGVALSSAQFGAFFYNVANERGESLTLYTVSGVPLAAFSKFPMPRNTRVFEPTFRGEGVVRSDDITRDPRYGHNPPYKGMPKGHLPVRSYLAVPVISRLGEVMGGLFFGHPKPGMFTPAHEELLVGVAAWAAIGIDNARLYQAAQHEIAERKQAEEGRQLLIRELNHRVKNLFAIASGMVTMTARTAATPKEMADTLKGRLGALARAHELIRTAIIADISPTRSGNETVVLQDLIVSILEPHLTQPDRLIVKGPVVQLALSAATSLALVLHELATNALKYGALSTPEGQLAIEWKTIEDRLEMSWREHQESYRVQPPEKAGFGSQLARTSVSNQLGGSLEYDWQADGVKVRFSLPLGHIR